MTMTMTKYCLLLLILVTLGGCGGEEPILPEVKPLAISAEDRQALYKSEPGPLPVANLETSISVAKRQLPLRVLYPAQEVTEPLPLVVFSHGNWSDNTKYDNLIYHWASHGYIVIAPYHLDAGGMTRGIFNSLRYGNLGLITERTADITAILDNTNQIAALLPASITLDSDAIAISGHSFGGFTAQQFAGARAWDVDQEQWFTLADDRVDAVLAISPPGPMFDEITKDSWTSMNKPMLMTTGTWDSNAQFWPDWRSHLISFNTAVPGNNHALVTEGADHYLGNLICRPEREQAPQHDALTMINSVSIAFLDAQLKDDAEARRYLTEKTINLLTSDFARISSR